MSTFVSDHVALLTLTWIFCLGATFMHLGGLAMGDSYDYLNHHRTYHGWKAFFWGILLLMNTWVLNG